MRSRAWMVVLFGGILVVLLTACAGLAPVAATPTETSQPLRFAWTYREGDYTLLVAQQLGLFERYGVRVEPVSYRSGNPYLQARSDLVAEVIDGGIFPIGDLLLMGSRADLAGVWVSDNGGIASVVASPEIASAAELRGKRIGVNLHTSDEMFVAYMLSRAGLNTRQVILVEMGPDAVVPSIPSVVDAGFVVEPYTTEARRNGLHVLYSSEQYSSLRPYMLVFRKRIAESRSQEVRAFLQAWDEAVAYRQAHPQEAAQLIEQATGRPASELSIAGAVTLYNAEDNRRWFADNPGLDLTSIYYVARFNLQYLISIGDITYPIDLDTLLNPSFLPSE